MANADGSVIIRARVDVSKADKDLEKLNGSIEKTEQEIEDLADEKEAARQKSVFSAAELDAEKAKLEGMRRQLEEMRAVAKDITMSPSTRQEATAQIPLQKSEIADQQTRVRLLQAEYNRIENSVSRYDEKIAKATRKLERQQEEAGELAQKINSVSKASLKMEEAQERAEKIMRKFGLRLKEVIRSALVFTIITQTLAKFREWMGKVVKTNDEARQAISRLKAALLTLAQPLVNVVIPVFSSFVNFLAKAVSYVAQLSAILFGTTAEDAAKSAEGLSKEQDAIEGVGDAAKKAGKQLASFDEINQLAGESASSSTDEIQPDFSGLQFAKLPEWLVDFTVTMRNIVFKWKNLTSEDVVKKIVSALGALAGAVIGFSVGGFGGAIIGMTVGASLGAMISSVLFNDDGTMSADEVVKSLITAAGAVVGGIIGFSVGGPLGAAIGLTIGAGVGALISSVVFDSDGKMGGEEIAKIIVAALGGLAGAVIGFSVGGPMGALIGATIGAGATVMLSGIVFDGDGKLNTEELLKSLCTAAGAIVGAAIGFAVGGPLGAVIGLTVGAVLTVAITDVLFKGFNDLKEKVPNFTGIGPDYSWLFKKESKVEVPNVSIASGTLIPKNAAFAQNGKTSIENLFPEGGFGAVRQTNESGNTTVVLELDGREFGRAVYQANKNESRRIGINMVGAR